MYPSMLLFSALIIYYNLAVNHWDMNMATKDKQKYLEITFVINLKLKTIFSKKQKYGCDCGTVLIKKCFTSFFHHQHTSLISVSYFSFH